MILNMGGLPEHKARIRYAASGLFPSVHRLSCAQTLS